MKTKWPVYIALPVVALLIWGLWYCSMITRPIVVPAAAKRPSPNAYDYYLAAGKMIKPHDALKIAYAIKLDLPKLHMTNPPPEYRKYSLSEKEALLANNRGALEKLREGFKYEYMQPAERPIGSVKTLESRKLAQLLVLEAEILAEREDWNGAVNSYLDAIKMSSDLPRGSGIWSLFCGARTISYLYLNQSHAIDRIDARAAKAAIKRMEEIDASRPPYCESIQEEKWSAIWTVNNGVKNPTFIYKLMERPSEQKYARYMDQVTACERYRYALRPPAPPEPRLMGLTAIWCNTMYVSDGARFEYTKWNMAHALLEVSLALRAYKLEHNNYPKTLKELVPTYLKTIPEDEFAKSGTLRYKPEGTKYLLYSVGPDGIDDGGKPSNEVVRLTRERMKRQPRPHPGWKPNVYDPFYVAMESKGDIVAGVNR